MATPPRLDALEARLLGVLVEKELTTPEQYPLSLNALTAGCNQKSNRDPVLDLSEAEIRLTTEALRAKTLIGASHPAGGRVERFHHGLKEVLHLDRAGLAVLAELLLRGPQTAGELRTRTGRMCTFASLEALTPVLARLEERGLARPVPPRPGSRAGRFGETLSPRLEEGDAATAAPSTSSSGTATASAPASPGPAPDRVATLEAEVRALRAALVGLAAKLGEELPELAD